MQDVKKSISIFLALLILISSSSLVLTTHYCGGRAVDHQLMVGNSNLDCGMMDMDISCTTHESKTVLKKKNCCDNEYVSFDIEDDYNSGAEIISLNPQFLFAFTYTLYQLHLSENNQVVAFSDLSPPPLEQDIQSLYQTFLL